MKINEFITKNYNYIRSIATVEYNKEKNKILYKDYSREDFASEVMLFFIKNYDSYDETKSKVRTFIITNCKFCAGVLRDNITRDNRKINLITANESELLTSDNDIDTLNPYENIGDEDFYPEANIFSHLTAKEKTLCLYKIHGLSMKEMEELTGCSRFTLWRYFKTIKEKLM
jgi:RNA polymerase sigma factor (sigma-70 family)